MSLKEYLTQNYASTTYLDKIKKKKKKKRDPKHSSTRVIDEEADWTHDVEEDDDAVLVEHVPVTTEKPIFKSSEDAGWVTVGEAGGDRGRRSPTPSDDEGPNSDRMTKRRHRRSPSPSPDRDQKSRRRTSPSPSPEPRRRTPSPQGPSTEKSKKAKMSDGTSGGLQKASDVKRELEQRAREQKARWAATSKEQGETIYRDATGRKVNLAAERAQQLAEQRAKEAEEEAMMMWGRGYVQDKEAKANAARLAAEADAPLAVYKDDVERNNELKAKERWGDPMAFIKDKSSSKYPVYKGPPPPPNRFGILPGYRWDGVDRSNGFEKKYFLSKNEQAVRIQEAYKWSSENM